MNRIYRGKNESAWSQLGRLIDSVDGKGLALARKNGYFTVLIASGFLVQCIECKKKAFSFTGGKLFAKHGERKIYFPGIEEGFAKENGVECS